MIALTKPGLPMSERALEEIMALGGIVLLATAATLFPAPKLPPS